MLITRIAAAALAFWCALAPAQPVLAQQARPTIAQFQAPGFPSNLVAARNVDRIAWLTYEEGKRNVYTAAAPNFVPVRLTNFLQDDGVEIGGLQLSDDGSTVIFVRGGAPNREGWSPNVTANPDGPDRAIWAAKTDGSGAWRLMDYVSGTLSPDGTSLLFARDGQIHRAKVSRVRPSTAMDRGEVPFIRIWGRNSGPRWSPDGSKIAFSSERTNHSYIAVYDMKARKITYVDPGVDFDTSPIWSADGKEIVFTRRPGTPFARQAQQGRDMMGNPPGPAYAARGGQQAQQQGRGGRGGGGRGGRGGGAEVEPATRADGLTRGLLPGGFSVALMGANPQTGKVRELWHPAPGQAYPAIGNATFSGDHFIVQRQEGEWSRYYSIPVSDLTKSNLLTPGDGMVLSTALSHDGKTFFYSTNAGDIDRRHIWKVATAGGTPVQVTTGNEIEVSPEPLASGRYLAMLTSSGTRPLSVGIVPVAGGAKKLIYPNLTGFPTSAHVEPQAVTLKAADGVEFYNQIFVPKNIRPGEKRPALIFVHGGPPRQMLLGYHDMHGYHIFYGVNQWFQSMGYVVMSVNYRLGIGYGRSFQQPANAGINGNSEYQDVLAAGKYLQSRPDVDPNKVGIWGGSYGGVLTSQALARNSDVFAAGVDLMGVHLWGNSLDTSSVSYKASAISAIDTWKSPVLVWHGDDDRNVDFSQTVGLIQLLRAHNVPHELIVFPDDTHETLLHSRWLYTFDRMQDFFQRHLVNRR